MPRLDQMRLVCDHPIITGSKPFEGTNALPDDEHIVTAALIRGADILVVENLRDFPASAAPSTSS